MKAQEISLLYYTRLENIKPLYIKGNYLSNQTLMGLFFHTVNAPNCPEIGAV
jgi:hypothetical protein